MERLHSFHRKAPFLFSMGTLDRVKTLKGTLRGVILEVLDDGRIKWRSDTGTELLTLPESLASED